MKHFVLLLLTAQFAHAAGGPGAALNFNGGDNYVSVPHAAALNAYPLTLTAWFKTSQTANSAALVHKVNFSVFSGYSVSIHNGSLLALYMKDGTAYVNDFVEGVNGGFVADGAWHHFAFVVDAAGGRLYVDGVLKDSLVWLGGGTPGAPIATTALLMGDDPASSYRYFGLMDEVTIWNVALTPAQILANKNRSLTGTEAGLIAYYRCDGAAVVSDSAPTGGNNDGSWTIRPAYIASDLRPFSPGAETLSASFVTDRNVTLNGVAYPVGMNTSAWFEWGTTTNYGNATPAQPIGSANAIFHQMLHGLSFDTTYHFRAVASNSVGVTVGNDQSFTVLVRLYSENFDTDHTLNWRVNSGPGNHAADFFFDYSTVGIPPAPGSVGTTRGLKLEANYAGDTFGGISVSPLNRNFSGDYVLTFDIWWNFVGPAPLGGSGSTQVTGAGVGSSGTVAQWAASTQESVHFGVTGDGQSAFDYRAYSSAAPSGYLDFPSSVVFAAGIRNNSASYYAGLGANTPPEAQTALYPQQTGSTATGAPAFRSHTGTIVKTGNTVTFSLDNLLIATVDATTVTFGGGNILFNQGDVNATSSTDPLARFLEFGLIDNVVVTRPVGSVPPTPGDSNGDGIVNQDELNAVLANYFSTSPWLQMTNAAGLGGTNVTFALTDDLAGAFSVEYTTNLNSPNWQPLGLATPRYLFADTNAPSEPQRYYRLRWP